MEFKLEEQNKPYFRYYSKTELELCREFCNKALHDYANLIKAVVLSRTPTAHHLSPEQIPIVIIIDDILQELTKDIITTYISRMNTINKEISPKIHIETIKLSDHWKLIQERNTKHINFIRCGISFHDSGFFDPVQTLLLS